MVDGLQQWPRRQASALYDVVIAHSHSSRIRPVGL